MKTIFHLILVFTIVSTIKVTGQGIIIDHSCTDLNQIPSSVIDDVQENIRFHYTHSSYGAQIRCGLDLIENSNPIYAKVIGEAVLPTVPDALCIYDGQSGNGGTQYITPNGYWLGTTGIQWTQNTLNENPLLNVSNWTWCAELNTYTEAEVQEYLDQMNSFEQQFPNVTFVYSTGNAQEGGNYNPEWGYNRHLRCDQIRQYCIDNNKILFDFEDLDCWYNEEFSYYIYNGDTIPLQHNAYSGNDCGHVNYLSATQKAKAVWWMMARIRGWQPNAQFLNIKVYLQGSYTPSGMMTTLNSQGLLPLSQPFNFPPINYNGNESVSSIPNANVVDWVLIELRDAVNAQSATINTVVERKAAFILNTGQIVDLDGTSAVQFTQTINQQLFLVLRHRSHLGIMSSFPLSANNNIYQYDFTSGIGKAYGGVNSQKQLSPGIWGMIGGDGYLDGVINNTDKTLTWKPDSGEKGYNPGDFNLNGNINNQDKNLIWITNFGKTSYIP